MKRGFGSDNHAGAHPRLIEAMVKANQGHVPSYGTDDITVQAERMFRDLFGEEASTYFVFNGTAANVLSLAPLVKPYQAIIASEHAHLLNDECGAPEKHIGCKVIPVPSLNAKISPADIEPYLIRRGDQHYSQIRAISITQPTELGTVYSIQEIKALASFAKRENLYLHVDGARLVNAAAALGCSFREMTTDCGVDVVSFGGTKNGMVFGEAVVFLKKGLDLDFKYIRKQAMQLPSKSRFISAQFIELLGTNLWLENSQHVNAMAKRLSQGLTASPFAKVTQATQANGCFACFDKSMISELRDQAFFYVWDEKTFECRLMMSWDTTAEDVDGFLSTLDRIGRKNKST
jgi:threonine aldolase